MPNSFLSKDTSSCLLSKEKQAALTHPAMIAGNTFLMSKEPCFHLKNEAITAEGMKNRRLMLLATLCSISSTRVSQSIRRLPPPTPNPDKKPRTDPIMIITGRLSSINIAPHPKGSESPAAGAAILWVCVFPKFRQLYRRQCSQSNMELQHPTGQCSA